MCVTTLYNLNQPYNLVPNGVLFPLTSFKEKHAVLVERDDKDQVTPDT